MKKYFFYLTLVLLCFAIGLIYSFPDWDLWARLTVGKVFLQSGHIFNNDFLSYTTTHRWFDHEWGSSVVFYFVLKHFGEAGIYALKAIVTFLTLFCVLKTVELDKRKETPYNIFFYWLLLMGMSQVTLSTIRCHIFTFMFYALWIYILERVRRGENRLLWIIPVTTIIWSNMHAGYVSGIGLLVMYAVGEFLNQKPWKKYALTLIPTCLVTLINPYGIGYVWYVLVATTMKRPHITEYMNSFSSSTNWMKYKVFFSVAVATFGYNFIKLIQAWRIKQKAVFKEIDYTKFIVVLVSLYLSVKCIKYQPFLIVAGGAFLYHDFYEMYNCLMGKLRASLKFLTDDVLKDMRFAKTGFIYLFIILGSVSLISQAIPLSIKMPLGTYPAKSYEFLKINKIKGNLLTDFQWGSYAEWKLYPQNYIAIDGRYEEVFDNSIAEQSYLFFSAKNNWYGFLRKFHTDVIVIGTTDPAYFKLINDKSKRWTMIYKDKVSAVMVPTKVAKPRKQYIQPPSDPNYYNKSKYETDINFKNEKNIF